MEIVINYNDDTLSIDGVVLYTELKEPTKVAAIIDEIFNRINLDSMDRPFDAITLVSINEDKQHTVGEW